MDSQGKGKISHSIPKAKAQKWTQSKQHTMQGLHASEH